MRLVGTVKVGHVRWQRRLCLSWCSLSSTQSGEPNAGCQLPPRADHGGTHRSMLDVAGPGGPVLGRSQCHMTVATWLRLGLHPVRWTWVFSWVSAPTECRPWGNLSVNAQSGFTRCVAVGVGDTLLWGTHQERHLHAVRLERRSGVTRIC